MLLDTKLLKPRLPGSLLAREDVLTVLDGGLDKRLTLVCGPAGYGKTTVLAHWLESRRLPHAWLSLEESDNDPLAFWQGICGALGKIDRRFSERVWPRFGGDGNLQVQAGLQALVQELLEYSRSWKSPGRVLLVLDDFHLIQQADVLEPLGRFLDFCPEILRVVVASRVQPSLDLPRRRVHNQLHEISTAHLRFDLPATSRFLAEGLGLELAPLDVRMLFDKTEGWPAALQLAGLSLQHCRDRAAELKRLDGLDRLLSDYLLEEIFNRQDADTQNFLRQVALVPRFSAAFCDAVLARSDSARLIEALMRKNLLIQRIETGEGWFRLHDLFRDWLRRLPVQDTQEIELRCRAAHWLEQAEQSYEAFEQWVALQDWGRATRLAMQHFLEWWQQGVLARTERALEKYPPAWRRTNPWLKFLEAFILFQRCDLAGALQALADARDSFENQTSWVPPGESLGLEEIPHAALLDRAAADFPIHLTSLRAHIARLAGDIHTAGDLSRELQQTLACTDSPLYHWTLAGCGTDQFYNVNLPLAREYCTQAIQVGRSRRNDTCQIVGLCWLVPTLYHQGELQGALDWVDRVQRDLGPGWETHVWAPELPYQRALIYREQNRLDLANQALDEAFHLLTDQLMPHCVVYFHSLRWLIALNQGDFAVAAHAIEEAERLHRLQESTTWNYTVLDPHLMRAILQAVQGNASELFLWAQTFDPQIEEEAGWLSCLELMVWLRLQLALQQDVSEPLQRFRHKAASGGVTVWQIRALIFESFLALNRGRPADAAETLEQALQMTQTNGLTRVYLDEGPQLVPILQACLERPAVAREARRLLQAFGVAVEPTTGLAEPLSEREREVLALLDAGLSNPALAEALGISHSTIKAHLRNIFGKLGVKTRTQALAQARTLHLLDASAFPAAARRNVGNL